MQITGLPPKRPLFNKPKREGPPPRIRESPLGITDQVGLGGLNVFPSPAPCSRNWSRPAGADPLSVSWCFSPLSAKTLQELVPVQAFSAKKIVPGTPHPSKFLGLSPPGVAAAEKIPTETVPPPLGPPENPPPLPFGSGGPRLSSPQFFRPVPPGELAGKNPLRTRGGPPRGGHTGVSGGGGGPTPPPLFLPSWALPPRGRYVLKTSPSKNTDENPIRPAARFRLPWKNRLFFPGAGKPPRPLGEPKNLQRKKRNPHDSKNTPLNATKSAGGGVKKKNKKPIRPPRFPPPPPLGNHWGWAAGAPPPPPYVPLGPASMWVFPGGAPPDPRRGASTTRKLARC